MADVTLTSVIPTFPVGSTVGVYLATGVPPSGAPGSEPSTALLTTGTVLVDGSVLLTDLPYDVAYVAGALVGGAWRYIRFRSPPNPPDFDLDLDNRGDQKTLLFDETSGKFIFINLPCLDVAGYGAIGDGDLHPLSERYGTLGEARAVYPFAADLGQSIDWCALHKALLAAATGTGPCVVYVPPDRHLRSDGVVAVPSEVELVIDGTCDFADYDGTAGLVTMSGTEDAEELLAANVALSAMAVVLPTGRVAAAGYEVGDTLRLGSLAYYNPVAHSQSVDVLIGERVRIEAITGDILTLETPVLSQTGYLTADGAFVSRINTHKRGSITGRGLLLGQGVGAAQVGIQMDRCEGFKLGDKLRVEGCEHRAAVMQTCFDGEVDWLNIDGCRGSSDGVNYGVSLIFMCEDVTVRNCRVRHVRHAVEQGGTADRSGLNRRITVFNNHAYHTKGAAYESHSGTEGGLISHNWAVGCQTGVSFRGSAAQIIGNRIIRPTSLGIWHRNQTTAATVSLISDNVIVDAARGCIRISSNEVRSPGGGQTIGSAQVVNNEMVRPGSTAIVIASTDTWRFKTVIVDGNTIYKPGGSAFDDGPTDALIVTVMGTVPGGVDPGDHDWAVSWVSAAGETLTSPVASAATDYSEVHLSNIPLGPSGTTARKIYRTVAGGTGLKLVTTISDNTTTTYTDVTADADLGGAASATAASNAAGISIVKADNVTLGVNVISEIDGTAGTRAAVKLIDVTKISVAAQQITWTSNVAGFSYRLVTCSGGEIAGGHAGAAQFGVHIDNDCTNITLRGVDVSECATPLSMGTGTGHRVIDCPGANDYPEVIEVLMDGGPGFGIDAGAAGTYSTQNSNQLIDNGVSARKVVLRIEAARYAVAGKTTQIRLRFRLVVNATAPARNFTANLYPVSAWAGAAAAVVPTVGAAVTGIAAAINAPAAGRAGTDVVGSWVNLPADGDYLVGVDVSGAMAAGSAVGGRVRVEYRHTT